MLDFYSENQCPSTFPVRTKCVALFQKVHGIDTLLFAVYVYEYGQECPAPNRRRVYISYLDSVQYFEPKCYRTTAYHAFLIEYLRYVKERGFHTAHIWSCPPTPGDDYIFYCHPEHQKVPREDMLRAWYHTMLDKAKSQGVVIRTTTLYDEYFSDETSSLVPNERAFATCLPYFEGDYIPGEIENILKHTKTKSPVVSSGARDSVMSRLGHNLSKMKENFIVVHLRSRRFASAVEKGEDVSNWPDDSDEEVVRSKRAKISGKDATETLSADGIKVPSEAASAVIPQGDNQEITKPEAPATDQSELENEPKAEKSMVVANPDLGIQPEADKSTTDGVLDVGPEPEIKEDASAEKPGSAELEAKEDTSDGVLDVGPEPEIKEDASAEKPGSAEPCSPEPEPKAKEDATVEKSCSAVSGPETKEGSSVEKPESAEPALEAKEDASADESSSAESQPQAEEKQGSTGPQVKKVSSADKSIAAEPNLAEGGSVSATEDKVPDESTGANETTTKVGPNAESSDAGSSADPGDAKAPQPVTSGKDPSPKDERAGSTKSTPADVQSTGGAPSNAAAPSSEVVNQVASEEPAGDACATVGSHVHVPVLGTEEQESRPPQRGIDVPISGSASGYIPEEEEGRASAKIETNKDMDQPKVHAEVQISTVTTQSKVSNTTGDTKDADPANVDTSDDKTAVSDTKNAPDEAPSGSYVSGEKPLSKRGFDEIRPAIAKHFAELKHSPDKLVADTTDEDPPFESELFESRQQFLNYCQTTHCQFDELRRAKHSTMMVLYLLHNPAAPKFLQQCGACYLDITHGTRYHCDQCPDFDLCQECYEPVTTGLWAKRDARFAHDKSHKFTAYDMEATAESLAAREQRQKALKGHIALLEHTGRCAGPPACSLQNCDRMKGFFRHVQDCNTKPKKDCRICSRLLSLCAVHARTCTARGGNCPIPFCDRIRERYMRLRRQQQHMDDRRRQAQNELYHAGSS